MPGLTTEVRVFVSSTFLDLKDLRAEVSRRLREIFGAHLTRWRRSAVIMPSPGFLPSGG